MDYTIFKAVIGELGPVIREYTAAAVQPLIDRLDEVERRLEALPQPIAPKEVDEAAIVARVSEALAGEIKEIRASVEAIEQPAIPDVAEIVAKALGEVREQSAQDAAEVQARIEEVARRVEEIAAKDHSGDIQAAVKAAVEAMPKPRDGLDVKELFRSEGGRLIATMSDGSVKDLGVFVGKDGEPGAPGKDGVGFDDMSCEVRDDGVYLVWEKDDVIKEARLPIPLYMGVYKADAEYKTGHCVTWGGSIWIALKDAPEGKPDAPGSDWKLAVKRGKDAV